MTYTDAHTERFRQEIVRRSLLLGSPTWTVTNDHGTYPAAYLAHALVLASNAWDGAGLHSVITDPDGNVVETMTDSTSVVTRY